MLLLVLTEEPLAVTFIMAAAPEVGLPLLLAGSRCSPRVLGPISDKEAEAQARRSGQPSLPALGRDRLPIYTAQVLIMCNCRNAGLE